MITKADLKKRRAGGLLVYKPTGALNSCVIWFVYFCGVCPGLFAVANFFISSILMRLE